MFYENNEGVSVNYINCCNGLYDKNSGSEIKTDYHIANISEYPSTETHPSVTMNKDEQKGESEMSFVGIMYNNNGVVVFSDSRSTYAQNNEKRFINDSTKKVFQSENFIFVTLGANMAYTGVKPRPLSRLINELLDGFTGTHREFVEMIKERLKDTFVVTPNAQFCFYFGFKDALEEDVLYGSEKCIITRPGIQFSELNYGIGYSYGGFYDFAPQTKLTVDPTWTVRDMVKRCEILTESVIKLGDTFMVYNPVGGEVQTKTLV